MQDVYQFETSSIPEPCRVLAFEATEALSNAYTLEVFLVAPADDEAADIEALLDADGSLKILKEDGSPRMVFHGIIAEAEMVQSLAQQVLYRVLLRPRFWRLTLSEHSKVWVKKKVFPDILEDVFKTAGLAGDEYELSLSKTYPELEHVCQYRESDFDFVSRWMEREGIYYFFKHEDAKEKLIVTDDASMHEKLGPDPVRYFPAQDDASAVEAFHWFRRVEQVRPEKVKLKDHDYLKPTLDVSGEGTVGDKAVKGEITTFGGNLGTPGDAKRLAKVRAEELAESREVFLGGGRVFDLRTGYKFELEDHPRSGLNVEYLATELRHRGQNFANAAAFKHHLRDQFAADDDNVVYAVEVRAIAAETPFRPQRATPWPRIWGLEPALVDGPADEDYAQIDDHGRYNVKILFDESDLKDGKASTWIRMAQPHAGAPEGLHFPLRKKTEVLLAFYEGDPDRPLIVGAVPEADSPSTVTKSNRTQNVIMTGGQNRIEIEDADGDQYVGIYSPTENSSVHLGAVKGPYHGDHNFALTTDGKGLTHTGGNRDITVGGDQTEDVKGNLTEDYHGNQTTHVSGNLDETIDAGAKQTITGGETRTVDGGITETITGGETRTISGGQTESYSGSVTRTVAASVTDTVGSSVTKDIGAAYTQTIGGSLTQIVAGGVTHKTSAMTVLATGGVSIVAPGGTKIQAPGGITFIDNFLDCVGGKHEPHKHFKNEAGIQKTEITGFAFGLFKIKMEFVGAASAVIGMAGKSLAVEDESEGAASENGAADVNAVGAAPKPA